MEGIFGLDSQFVDTLSEAELTQLQAAKTTLDNIEKKYQKWQGGSTDEDVKAYIKSKAAKEATLGKRAAELRKSFI